MLALLLTALGFATLPPPDPALAEPTTLTEYRAIFSRQQAAEPTDDLVVLVDRAEELDQAIRHAAISLWFQRDDPAYADLTEAVRSEMVAHDLERVALVRAVVEDGSWLDEDTYPDRFRSNVWLIAQHSPDHAFMALVLSQIEPLALVGRFDRREYAMMYDRVAGNEGRPQRYGTQMRCIDGTMQPGPLEDPENVNALRAAMGFEVVRIEDAIANANRFPCD